VTQTINTEYLQIDPRKRREEKPDKVLKYIYIYILTKTDNSYNFLMKLYIIFFLFFYLYLLYSKHPGVISL